MADKWIICKRKYWMSRQLLGKLLDDLNCSSTEEIANAQFYIGRKTKQPFFMSEHDSVCFISQ